MIKRFRDLVREYINEIAETGFPDAPRMEKILNELRRAAEREFISEDAMNKVLSGALETYFKRATSPTRIAKSNPGVQRFTLAQVVPTLRQDLDRRILANAQMIKINRQQAIDKTLQRFSGWMSSVPVGGTDAINKTDVLNDITKTEKQLKYETRRREIDQGHKLMAAIDATIAGHSGAIAMEWRSHWKQPGYDFRPDHKERDKKIYAIRGSWAMDQGLINKGAGYTDEITSPAEEPYCRCNGVYLTNLRDLPEDMLTAKGKQALEDARSRIRNAS